MIQVDMFEVQLGASLLLQFQGKDGQSVRVLADGGQGPPRSDIRQKVSNAFGSFGDRERRIDLLLGTHYDADHLDGLVPIIEDRTIAIAEAWLPPVANDVEPDAIHLLPHQFYSPDGRRILARYLDVKAHICRLLRPADRESAEDRPFASAEDMDLRGLRAMFERYRREALEQQSLDSEREEYTHADEDCFVPTEAEELLKQVDASFWWVYYNRLASSDGTEFTVEVPRTVRLRSIAAYNVAGIRKSAASDAINAISLFRIVTVLRARQIPITCHIIADGTPQRFTWHKASRRFESSSHLPAEGPTVVVLGPSEGLVRKHWHRLPVGVYAHLATQSLSLIKSITPSNQLSYVTHFSSEDQGILVAGDAGCVDFKPRGRRPYYDALLRALCPLHVVQVAHHAGNNAHFYRALKSAGYPRLVKQSFLLLSHATHDRHRPAHEFREFVAEIRREPGIMSLLFTAEPEVEKIRGFENLIHGRVGLRADRGDARLEFRDGTWTVTKHAIEVGGDSAHSNPSIALDHNLTFKPLRLRIRKLLRKRDYE